MAKITITDIAQLVGVSTATISNYLNGNFSRMSEKTRTRIAEIIQNTNYQPSNAAHQLAAARPPWPSCDASAFWAAAAVGH